MNQNVLILFVKYPSPGKVKTRLAKTVGDEEAARMYRSMVQENLAAVMPVYRDGICDLVVAFDPPEKERKVRTWLSVSCRYIPQNGADLGERLKNAFQDVFQRGGRRIMVLGSDTLGLTSDVIGQGFRDLESSDSVIGPAADGGYYLIGISGFHPELFEGIAWSTEKVLPQTQEKIFKLGLSCRKLRELEDLDELKIGEAR